MVVGLTMTGARPLVWRWHSLCRIFGGVFKEFHESSEARHGGHEDGKRNIDEDGLNAMAGFDKHVEWSGFSQRAHFKSFGGYSGERGLLRGEMMRRIELDRCVNKEMRGVRVVVADQRCVRANDGVLYLSTGLSWNRVFVEEIVRVNSWSKMFVHDQQTWLTRLNVKGPRGFPASTLDGCDPWPYESEMRFDRAYCAANRTEPSCCSYEIHNSPPMMSVLGSPY